jgi:hypothetical protein
MDRITYDFLMDAYQKADMIPIHGVWFEKDKSGKYCGCGLTAICASTLDKPFVEAMNEDEDYPDDEAFVLKMLQGTYSDSYISGFIIGFDGWEYRSLDLIKQTSFWYKDTVKQIARTQEQIEDIENGLQDGYSIGRKIFYKEEEAI